MELPAARRCRTGRPPDGVRPQRERPELDERVSRGVLRLRLAARVRPGPPRCGGHPIPDFHPGRHERGDQRGLAPPEPGMDRDREPVGDINLSEQLGAPGPQRRVADRLHLHDPGPRTLRVRVGVPPGRHSGQFPPQRRPAVAAPGDLITYTLYYNNTNTGNARTLWINDTLPLGTAFSSSSAPFNSVSGQTYGWIFLNVVPGAHSFTLTAQVTAAATDGQVLGNTATLAYVDTLRRPLPGSAA